MARFSRFDEGQKTMIGKPLVWTEKSGDTPEKKTWASSGTQTQGISTSALATCLHPEIGQPNDAPSRDGDVSDLMGTHIHSHRLTPVCCCLRASLGRTERQGVLSARGVDVGPIERDRQGLAILKFMIPPRKPPRRFLRPARLDTRLPPVMALEPLARWALHPRLPSSAEVSHH